MNPTDETPGDPLDDPLFEDESLGPASGSSDVNVGPFERGASITIGAALLALVLSRRKSPGDLLLGALGAYLALRGATGHCVLYDALDTGTAVDEEDDRLGAGGHDDESVEASITLAQAPEAVYAFWRNLENVPRFMRGIESVTPLDESRSRWRARGPEGEALEWEAEILEDRPGELIVWRSVPEAEVHHHGAVSFRPGEGGGTEVRLAVERRWPASVLGRALANVFGDSEDDAGEDLERLKAALET